MEISGKALFRADRTSRWLIALGALSAALAVALAAASAHAFPDLGSVQRAWLQTALDYQKFHALGLIVVGLAAARYSGSRWILFSGGLLLAGMLMFCGSLYLRSLFDFHELRRLTPLGGASFILGWLLLAIGVLRSRAA